MKVKKCIYVGTKWPNALIAMLNHSKVRVAMLAGVVLCLFSRLTKTYQTIRYVELLYYGESYNFKVNAASALGVTPSLLRNLKN